MADRDDGDRGWLPKRGDWYIPIPVGLLIKLIKWLSKRVFGR